MKEELITFFNEYKKICNAYQMAQSTMYYDIATVAPQNGIPKRNECLAILAGEAFSYQMNPDHLEKLKKLYQLLDEKDDLKKELKLYFRNLEMIQFLPKDIYIDYTHTLVNSENIWHQAKEKKDYTLFHDTLVDVIQKQKDVLSYTQKKVSYYDYLLDTFQMGLNKEKYDLFFHSIKQELLPLIKQIIKRGRTIDDSLLYQSYDISLQEQFAVDLHQYMKVNPKECCMQTTEHPFTEFFSAHEARITTHYYTNNLKSAIFSTIHEYGHALYALQVREEYDGTTFKNSIGSAMHESQSRLLENHIGRHRSFWVYNYPKLQHYFPEKFNHISLDAFMDMLNAVHPSFVRTEADELTYPIHILIRYELEKEMFDGNIENKDLKQMWNDKYEEYLGIRPIHDDVGILQDIHWAGGNFGYFPTYALGSAYAAQFYHAMEKDLDIAYLLENGQFEEIAYWLKTHIHQYGAYYDADEILYKATGETFNCQYYIDYLKTKYSQIYQL